MATSIKDSLLVADEMPDIALRIMFAAIELFGRKGYSATSVREIVQKARVTNPMLYYYFDSKKGLFERTIEHLLRMRTQAIRAAIEEENDFAQKLRRIVDFHLDSLCESREILTFIYAIVFGPRESRPDYNIMASVEEIRVMLGGLFADAIESGEFEPADESWDSETLAEAFIGQISIHLMHALKTVEDAECESDRDEVLRAHTSEQAREKLIHFYLRGAGTPRGRTDE